MWVKAVEKAGTVDPDKVIDALARYQGAEPDGRHVGNASEPSHHQAGLHRRSASADGQFDVVWKTPGLVPGDAWSKELDGSKDLVADWVKLKCGNYNTKTSKCGGQGS